MNPIIYQRRGSDESDGSMSSHDDYTYSQGTVPSSVPSLDHRMDSVDDRFDTPLESANFQAARASAGTYTSTVASYEDEDDSYYYAPKRTPRPIAVPSTPAQFAELFPSERTLSIKHDESTYDGNMNIRVDCDHACGRLTLFHVRLYDLRNCEMSVRRYGRDCGREVAKIKRRYERPATPKRPHLQRTVSKAVQSFLGKTDAPEFGPPSRQDSGYCSDPGVEDEEEDTSDEPAQPLAASGLKPTNSCVLEFSNYAHVDIARKGQKQGKKYDFEYWGKTYSWKRAIKHEGLPAEQVSFTLLNTATAKTVAIITPDALTPEMAAEQYANGGFVPPCTMKLIPSPADPIAADRGDIADVIISTGLLALIDDNIKRKYHKKRTVQIVLPAMGKMNMEYVGPRRLLDEMFQRRPAVSRTQSAQVSRSGTPTPSRRPTH